MKNNLFYLLFTLFCFSCGEKPTHQSLEGLWYDEENNEELFFKNDSLSNGYSAWPFRYKINRSNEIIALDHNNDIIDEYQFKQDTIFSDNYRNHYIKIPFNSVLAYRLDKMGINIDFFKGKTKRINYSNKHNIINLNFLVGHSKEDSTKKILVYHNKKFLLDTFEKVDKSIFIHNDFISDRRSHVYYNLFLDKNLSFQEYSKIRLLFHENGLWYQKINFVLMDKETNTSSPENLNYLRHFPSRLNFSEKEHALPLNKYAVPNPPPFRSLKESIKKGLKTTNISLNQNNQITLEGNIISKDNLYSEMRKKFLEAPLSMSFVYAPHPESKLETYLFVRNTLYEIQQDILQEYALEHYMKDYSKLPLDAKEVIIKKFYIIEHLIY